MGILINRTAKCLSYREPWGSAGPHLAFYTLEMCGEREACLALLVPRDESCLWLKAATREKQERERRGDCPQKGVHSPSQLCQGNDCVADASMCVGSSALFSVAKMHRDGMVSEGPQVSGVLVGVG